MLTKDTDLVSSDSEDSELPDLYQEGDWKSDCNFKSRTGVFEVAAKGLRYLLKKSPKRGSCCVLFLDFSKQFAASDYNFEA